jgi:hypothetical protein
MTTTPVTVRTVGLDKRKQSELTLQLAANPQIDLQHFPGWDFRHLGADIIVLGLDASVGQEALDMLRFYAGVEQPVLVTYSRHDELFRALGGPGGVPSFETRLGRALRRAGCFAAVVAPAAPDPATARRSRPLLEAGADVPEGVRWRG